MRAWCVVVAAAALAACTANETTSPPGTASAPPPVFTGLAPSQTTPDTAAPPTLPPACVAGELEAWTAAVAVTADSVSPIIRIRNRGTQRCELDLSGTDQLAGDAEPDLWLDPDGWGEIVTSPSAAECDAPTAAAEFEFEVDGVPVVVPSAVAAVCGTTISHVAPLHPPGDPCAAAQLDGLAIDGFLLVRNVGNRCVLGGLSAVDGNSATTAPRPPGGVEIEWLEPGDVVAFGQRFDDVLDCDGGPDAGTVTLVPDVVLEVDALRCGAVYESGPALAYFGHPDSAFVQVVTGGADPATAVLLADPFGEAGEAT